MHKQDNTNRDTGLDSIMESMYSNEAKKCPKCGKVHPINASSCGAHEAIDDEDTGRIPHDVDSFGTSTIGTDADGTEIEQGHIVQYDPTGAHQSDPQVSDAQWIVSGAAVAGPDNEAMVDIIQLGKDISVPAKQLLVQGELGG